MDRALEVSEAKEVARSRGRWSALKRLKGKRVLRKALSRESGAKKRDIDVVFHLPTTGTDSKKKRPPRPGRPTGWPRLKADRMRVAARSLELLAFPERRKAPRPNDETPAQVQAVHLGGSSDDPYVPVDDEMHSALRELTTQVASATGRSPSQMPPPSAFISFVTDGGSSFVHRRGAQRAATNVTVSLAPNTASVEFRSNGQLITPPTLDRGDALLYDPSASHRLPTGDWHRVITYDL